MQWARRLSASQIRYQAMPRRRRIESASNPYSTITTAAVSTTRAGSGTISTGTVTKPSTGRSETINEQQQQLETQDCQVSSTTTNLMQEIQSFPLVTTLQIQQNDPELDADKKTIMSHPLYPLLALLLQQCEMASARPDSPPPLDAFNAELKAYVQRQVELEDAELCKTSMIGKQREKPYYGSGGTTLPSSLSYESPYNHGRSASTRGGRHHGKLNSRENTPTTTTTGEPTYIKSNRPRSRNDCRVQLNEKVRDCETSALIDGDCGQDSGTESTLFDEDRKLKVFVNNNELDELIVKAIQVLRIHLLELHKVNELCKDFCSRYIHSLKTKFQTDPLIHDSSQPSSPSESEAQSPNPTGCYGQRYFPSGGMTGFPCPLTGEVAPPDYRRHQLTGLEGGDRFRAAVAAAAAAGVVAATGLSPTRGTGGGGGGDYAHSGSINGSHNNPTGYHNTDMTGLCYTPNCHMLDYGAASYSLKQNHGSAAASEDDNRGDGFAHLHPFLSPYNNAHNVAAFHAGLDNLCVGIGKQKRGVLPKRATQIMKQWLFQHLVHPYPTEDEKRQIANQTNLTLLQVNNWFINARRRILQPMLDASNFVPLGNSLSGTAGVDGSGSLDNGNDGLGNSEPPVINKKKKAATSRPSNNRFWPASLVAAAAIHPVAAGLASSGSNTLSTSSGAIYTCQNGIRTGERALDSTVNSEDDKPKEITNYSVLNKSCPLDGPVHPSTMRYTRSGMQDSYVTNEIRHFPSKTDETETWSSFASVPAPGALHSINHNHQFPATNRSNSSSGFIQANPPPLRPQQQQQHHHPRQHSTEEFPPQMHLEGSHSHLTYQSSATSLGSVNLGDCNPTESNGQSTTVQPDTFSSNTGDSGLDTSYRNTHEPNHSNSGERPPTHTDFFSSQTEMKPQKVKRTTENISANNPTQTIFESSPDQKCVKDPSHERNSPSNCTSNEISRNIRTLDMETRVDQILRNIPESNGLNTSGHLSKDQESLRSHSHTFNHMSTNRNPVNSFSSQMAANLNHSEMIFGLDYMGKLNQFHTSDYPSSSDAQPPLSQQQQQHAQSYSNYLASGTILSNPSPSNTGTGSFQSPYASDLVGQHHELAPNPFSHLPPFYSSTFPTASLLHPCSNRPEIAGPPPSFLTSLADPWNNGQNFFGSGNSSASSSGSSVLNTCYPFSMPWTSKFRRLTPPPPSSSTTTTSSGSTDLPMHTCSSTTAMNMPSVADYPLQFHPKLTRMHTQTNGTGLASGGLIPAEYSTASTASANINQSDYMRSGHPTSMEVDGNFQTKSQFPTTSTITCNYPKSEMTGSHSVFKLSSPYLSTTHSPAL